MVRQRIMTGVVLSLCIVVSTGAQEKPLGITLDTTFVSKYMWHGFNLYGNDNWATQPSVNVDLWGTGFGFNVWHSRANRSGFRDFEEFDYTVYYGNSAFEETSYATDYTFSWLYYDYSDAPSSSDLQELIMQLSWPKIMPGGVVPSYTVGRLWESQSGSAVAGFGGWVHVLGLGYDWAVGGPDGQVVSLMADITYNDGYNGPAVDHDWSHATVGASTSYEIRPNLSFTPAVYYQISMDDSVNNQDEVWTGLSLTYEF